MPRKLPFLPFIKCCQNFLQFKPNFTTSFFSHFISMSLKRLLFIPLAIATLAVLINSCETEVDLEAPYKSTAVIVGILDLRVDTQFVRINRTYLGSGDANIYAGIRDSVEYAQGEVEAWLIKLQNGNAIDSIQLLYTEKPSRDPGVFYNTNVAFYYTTETLFTDQENSFILNEPSSGSPQLMRYALKVKARGQTYRAETDFPAIGTASVTFPPSSNPPIKLEFYRVNNNSFQSLEFRYNQNRKTARYLGVLRFNYSYNNPDGSLVQNQIIDYELGFNDNSELRSGATSFLFNSENWYTFIGQQLRSRLPNAEKIRVKNVEFRLTGANEDLNTYINTTRPSNDGVTPILTQFTNFDNGAIGILGSRSTIGNASWLLDPSLNIMNNSELTEGPCYCADQWSGSSLVCTNVLTACP